MNKTTHFQTSKLPTALRLTPVVRFGFGLLLTAVAGVGVISVLTNNTLKEANEWVTYSWKVRSNLSNLEKLLLDAETGQRGFILTGRDDFLEPYTNAQEEIGEQIDTLRDLVSVNTDNRQSNSLIEIQELSSAKMGELAETIKLKRMGQNEQAVERVLSGQGKDLMDEIRKKMLQMSEVEDEILEERLEVATDAENNSFILIVTVTVGAIALGIGILLFIARKVVQPINEIANSIASSASEIAVTIEQQERTANQQAIAVHQTTTTMEELEASSQQSANQAESASSSSIKILTLANGENQLKINSFIDDISLTERVQHIADQILNLSEQTNQIVTISNLVSDLASQTNMLAINAAVEAARSGENGKGFAVVASEIRKLADQSRKSAEQITTKVSDIRNATHSTVLVTDEGTKSVEKIVVAIHDITTNIQQISLTSKQQAVAVQQVVEAMNSLNTSASENASGISQIKVGISQLQEASLSLKTVV